MRIRILVPISFALLMLAAGVACGDDDSSSSTPTATASANASPSASATASASAAASPSATAAASATPIGSPTPAPTAKLFVDPSRDLPPADHNAIGVFDVITFYQQKLNGGQLTPFECTSFDMDQGIIDCTAQGFGTIAVDPIPESSVAPQCRALLDPNGQLFAASCSATTIHGPATYIYAIQN